MTNSVTLYVKVGDGVYGPYPLARLRGFVEEGRVHQAALVGGSPSGPFAPARQIPQLAGWFDAGEDHGDDADDADEPAVADAEDGADDARAAPEAERPAPQTADTAPVLRIAPIVGVDPRRRETPAQAPAQPRPQTHRPAASDTVGAEARTQRGEIGAERSLFVLVEADGRIVEAVYNLLTAIGEVAWATDASWFVNARASADALRNTLSRELTPDAALVVIDLSANNAAWFNLGSQRDAAIRRLREDETAA